MYYVLRPFRKGMLHCVCLVSPFFETPPSLFGNLANRRTFRATLGRATPGKERVAADYIDRYISLRFHGLFQLL